MYLRYPLALRNVENLLFERGIDICHETARLWWNRFGPMFASEIRRRRVQHMRAYTPWRWHFDEVYVKINGQMRYLWRAVDHEGEVLESFVTTTRDKAAALKFIKKGDEAPRMSASHRHGQTPALRRSTERDRRRRSPGNGTPAQQSGRKLPSAFPTTRTGDAEVSQDHGRTNGPGDDRADQPEQGRNGNCKPRCKPHR